MFDYLKDKITNWHNKSNKQERYVDFEIISQDGEFADAFSLTEKEVNSPKFIDILWDNSTKNLNEFMSYVELVKVDIIDENTISFYVREKRYHGEQEYQTYSVIRIPENITSTHLNFDLKFDERRVNIYEDYNDDYDPYAENYWGDRWFCIRCGSELEQVAKDNKDWGNFCWGYMKRDGTLWFLCSNNECCHHYCPLVLFNSTGKWTTPAGDNYAIGFVK